jgi:hypothetical protein
MPPSGWRGLPVAFRRSGIYLGWVGYNNLGDEAMWQVCRERFPQIRWSTFDLVHTTIGHNLIGKAAHDFTWLAKTLGDELGHFERTHLLLGKLGHRLGACFAGEVAMLGGGTLINRNRGILNSYRRMRKEVGRPVPVFGSGVASSRFWSPRGNWEDLRREWVDLLRELPVVGVRGPYSRCELEDAGLTNVIVSGDLAVLLHEPLHTDGRRQEPHTIAINFGEPLGGMSGVHEQVEEALLGAARELSRSHEVKFVPVWPQDREACERLAQRAGLFSSSVLPVCVTYEQLKSALRDVRYLIAFKLHAGIVASCCNVPFTLIEYQPKCRDFMASLGWEEFVVPSESVTSSRLLDQFKRVDEDFAELQSDLCRRMCALSKAFKDYCGQIEPLLAR